MIQGGVQWSLTFAVWYLGLVCIVCIESWLIINHRYWITILAIAGQGAIVLAVSVAEAI